MVPTQHNPLQYSIFLFQGIVKLTLTENEFRGSPDITHILGALPALESLKLILITPNWIHDMYRGASIFPKLKRLKFQEKISHASWIVFSDCLACNNGHELFPSLSDISIRDIEMYELYSLGNLFRILGPKLSKLSVTFNDAINPESIKKYLDLKRNPGLRQITVRFRFYHRTVSVLEPSMVLLRSASASLQDLTIIFDGSVSTKKLSKVDWSLMDDTLSDPAFTKLRRITFLQSAPERFDSRSVVNEIQARLPKITSMGITQWGRLRVAKGPRR